jgi:NAD(P)-dependent dehydrogenase (short-subunit alcohol dehydrogenase family)
MSYTVLVSGGSGYIAGYLIRQLVNEGWMVHTTVRSLAKEAAVRELLKVDNSRLKFFAADLNADAGWAQAMAGCSHVAHVASPLPMGIPKDANELIVPARDGALRVDAQGQLVTANGQQVQPGITIPANASAITIGSDGVVTAMTPGATAPAQLGQLQVATFVNPAGLDPAGQNMFRETAASGTPTVGTPGLNGHGSISQGYVETSNVNVVEELVSMIQTQRAYEINSKAIQTSDQMLGRLSQL